MPEILTDQREPERALILSYLKNSINTLVYGPSGIGKTTLINSVIKEVNDSFGQAVYVNCSLYQTANAVLREILLSLGSMIASKSNYELTKRLKEKTRKVKLFVFLDHFENLKKDDILNILIGLDFCVCLVSDSFESYKMMSLTQRTRFVNVLKMEKLTDEEITEVLRGVACNKMTDEMLWRIVEKSDGNLTLALNMLRSFEANHGNFVIEQIDLIETSPDKISSMGSLEILQLLEQRKKLPSGELYRLYCEKSEYPRSERSFRNYMEDLCRKGLVRSIGDKKGRFYEIIEIAKRSLEHG
jgi:DNA polymerase III delta prime subunit